MFKTVVDLLLPHFKIQEERQSIIFQAFHDQHDLPYDIDYSGPATIFTRRLIGVLQKHGEIAMGLQALWHLLLTIREDVGPDQQLKIDALKEWANQPHQPQKLFMVESLPDDFVPRPEEFEQIVVSLISQAERPVAITTALKGAGGYGKTTLARAVCHDVRVQKPSKMAFCG